MMRVGAFRIFVDRITFDQKEFISSTTVNSAFSIMSTKGKGHQSISSTK